ncbi:hypothetical protein [Marinomonas algicola]|uniref:hypothetical protein n=1 Tax=Marinomonas algicola TaxID=2773454 RepID=UPI00174DB804|nr:hypothetical protein [Marinomonas algicola]
MFRYRNQTDSIVLFEFAGPQSLEEHIYSLKVWNEQLSRNQPFVAIRLFLDEASLIHPKGAAKETKRWLNNGASDAIKHNVIAMINIVPEKSHKKMKNMSVETVFGVPGGIFQSIQEAQSWFNTTLGHKLRVDLSSSTNPLTT